MSAPNAALGPIPLIDGISMTIAADRGGWRTTFARGGETIAEDHAKTFPWIGRHAAGHLAGVLCEAVPLNRDAVKTAILAVFDAIQGSTDAATLTGDAAGKVIAATEAVKIELSDPPTYTIDLKGGRYLIFTTKELAAARPITLNEKWLSAFPRDPLNATGIDFQTVIDYWVSIGEEVQPTGNANKWEIVAESLQIRIAPLPAHPTRDGLVKSGLYQEENGPLWISSRLIADVVRDAGRDANDTGFAKYLQDAGDLIVPSKPIRVGGMRTRAWGFRPEFKPTDQGIVDCVDLIGEEAGA